MRTLKPVSVCDPCKPLMLTLMLIQVTAEPDFLIVCVVLTQLENKLYEASDCG